MRILYLWDGMAYSNKAFSKLPAGMGDRDRGKQRWMSVSERVCGTAGYHYWWDYVRLVKDYTDVLVSDSVIL